MRTLIILALLMTSISAYAQTTENGDVIDFPTTTRTTDDENGVNFTIWKSYVSYQNTPIPYTPEWDIWPVKSPAGTPLGYLYLAPEEDDFSSLQKAIVSFP